MSVFAIHDGFKVDSAEAPLIAGLPSSNHTMGIAIGQADTGSKLSTWSFAISSVTDLLIGTAILFFANIAFFFVSFDRTKYDLAEYQRQGFSTHRCGKHATSVRSSARSNGFSRLPRRYTQGWRTKTVREIRWWLNNRAVWKVYKGLMQFRKPILDRPADPVQIRCDSGEERCFGDERHRIQADLESNPRVGLLESWIKAIDSRGHGFEYIHNVLSTTLQWYSMHCFIRRFKAASEPKKSSIHTIFKTTFQLRLNQKFRSILILCALIGPGAANDLPGTNYLGVDRNIISEAISYFGDLIGPAAVIVTFLVGSAILFAIVFCTKSRRRTPRKLAFVAGIASVSWWLMELVDKKDESQKEVIGWICALLWAVLLSLCAKGLEESDRFLFETLCSGGLTVMGIIFLIVAIRILEEKALDHNAMRIALSFGLPPLNAWTWFQFKRHLLRELGKSGVMELFVTDQNVVRGSSSALEAQELHVRGAIPVPAAVQRPPLAIAHA